MSKLPTVLDFSLIEPQQPDHEDRPTPIFSKGELARQRKVVRASQTAQYIEQCQQRKRDIADALAVWRLALTLDRKANRLHIAQCWETYKYLRDYPKPTPPHLQPTWPGDN